MVAKLAQILLVPTGLLLGAILLAPDSWKVAAFVGALWFLLPAVRGRVLIAYIALFASVTLWIVYSADTAVAFPLALVPLLLTALLPGRKWGINDDYDPASGVAR